MAAEDDTKMDGKSLDITKENIAALKELFPEIVTEEKIDFDKLKLILGEEVDSNDERYNFTWHGKNQAIRLSQTPSMGTLRPCKEESVDWDTTQNLYIEGDNLEVLKLLQKSYFGKVKMIYIDPPYNTGKDFVYKDDFKDNIQNYKLVAGQIDDDGNRITTNTSTDGRYHTNWLNMIYPRLKIARNLLADNGVIFISIDDNEVDNLSKICSEIFGESNFICKFVWKSKLGKVGTTNNISTVHEYILCYSKSIANISFKKIVTNTEGRKENLRQWGTADRREDRPSMFYPIIIDGTTVLPIKDDGSEGRWRVGEETAKKLLADGALELSLKQKYPNIMRIFPPGKSETPFDSLLTDIGTTAKGAMTLRNLGMANCFDYSKPVELIRHFINLFKEDDFIIMDFFAGSSTTAQAVLEANKDDGGKRSFICIQLPESIPDSSEAKKSGYDTIYDVGIDRIRRVISEFKKGNQTSLYSNEHDLGFRVFKLDSSNVKRWNPSGNIKQTLIDYEDNIVSDSGRANLDIVYEIMLKMGLELTSKMDVIDNGDVTFYSISSGALMICLDDIEDTTVADKMISIYKEQNPFVWKVVFKDNGFASDDVKANTRETLKMAGLPEGSFVTL